jgi:hypothetical protein
LTELSSADKGIKCAFRAGILQVKEFRQAQQELDLLQVATVPTAQLTPDAGSSWAPKRSEGLSADGQEEAIILGIGGENSNSAKGYFFEEVMTRGMTSAKTMQASQSNIVSARYAGDLKP